MKCLPSLMLCAALFFGALFPVDLLAEDYPLMLTIVNNSGFDDTKIYLLCTGSNQPGPEADNHFGYLDFSQNKFVETGAKSNFSLNSSSMTVTLNALKSNNAYTIAVPQMVSGRLYFAFGDNFDKCPGFTASGPPNGENNTVVYDKVEFDTWSDPNMNVTNVDFFGISYYIAATNTAGNLVTRGYATSRDAVFAAFENTGGNDYSFYGNGGIFESLIIDRPERDGIKRVRILAPKNAAYTDFSALPINTPQKCSHFFDQYVNHQCWKPNRQFSFYSKFYKPSDPDSDKRKYYGQVTPDGMSLLLFTDENRTVSYQIPSLPRPSSSNFFFPSATQWHQVDSDDSDQIDWGYLLGGQVGGMKKGAYWATDPVVMAITTSIVRGVMHYDDGCDKWTNSNNFYQGDNHINTAEFPVYYYGKLIHDLSIEHLSYALSYDDVFGTDPSVYFKGHPNVILTFNSVKPSSEAVLSVRQKSLYADAENGTATIDVYNADVGGSTMNWKAEIISGKEWLRIISGAGTDTGAISCGYDGNTTADFRVGVVQLTADGAMGSPMYIPVTQSPNTSACTATLSKTFLLHIPYLSYVDSYSAVIPFTADFGYDFNPAYPSLIIFKLTGFDVVKGNPFYNCIASTLSDDLKIHVSDVLSPDGTTHLWLDLEYMPALSKDGNYYFAVTNFG